MGKIRVGNKANSILNGEWAGHVRAWGKRFTSRYRRQEDKKEIRNQLKEIDNEHITNRGLGTGAAEGADFSD